VTTIDPEKERGRLSEIYSSKTDEELQQVDEESGELTDIAQEVLREELARRRLPQHLRQPDVMGQNELEFRDLVTIRAFWGLLEAQLAKGLLDSAGIESFLFDDNMVRMDWFNANALGGVKLRVDAHNVEAANRVLQDVSDDVEPEEPESLA
jgi:putative signal transducing protein